MLQTIFLRLAKREIGWDVFKNPKPYLHRAAVNVIAQRDSIPSTRGHSFTMPYGLSHHQHRSPPRGRGTLPGACEKQSRS